ncbi:hypothetical protein [Klebsiella variicola]|uniref:hypothetical protein n=1 Tax=Klebsiella variicola TaxID=244366 RepID=UPI0009081FE9
MSPNRKGLASQEQEQEQEKGQDQKKGQDQNTMSDSDRTGGVCSDGQKDQPAQEVPEGETGGTGEPDPVDVAFENIFWGAGLRKDAKVKARTAFRTKYRYETTITQSGWR